MIIDTHTHFIPQFVLDEQPFGLSFDGSALTHAEQTRYPIAPTFTDVGARLDEMKDQRIDRAVLSLVPTLFFYEQPTDIAGEYARRANDDLAAMVGESDRLTGIATLPLGDPAAAVTELERAVSELGLRGAQIGTNAESRQLDDPELEQVFATAARLGVPLMLHPYFVAAKPQLEDYYLTNTLGNPIDTTNAAARVIHSGVLDRLPDLRIALVHGGGFLPYQLGRLDRAYEMRAEPRVRRLERRPSDYLERFWFDSITHDDETLRFLADKVGPQRLILGTDNPFDMADPNPVGRIERVGLDARDLVRATEALFDGSL